MGILRGSGEILKHAWEHAKRTYYIDHSYLQGWTPRPMFRLCINSLFNRPLIDPPDDRANAHLYWLQPKKVEHGDRVLICSQTQQFLDFCGEPDFMQSAEAIASRIYPGSEIFKRIKTTHNKSQILTDRIEKFFHGSQALFTHASSAAVKAIYYGLNVHASPCYITSIFDGNHERFTRQIAYCQFTLPELQSGAAKEAVEYVCQL